MIITYAEWMKQTYGGMTSVRSGKLKAVDAALRNYHLAPNPANQALLLGALLAWMQNKGNDWRTSVRNKTNVVETLYRQLTDLAGGGVDAAAKAHLERESQEIIRKLFNGATLTWKTSYKAGLASLNSEKLNPAKLAEQYKLSASTNKFGTALNSAGVVMNSVGVQNLRDTGNSSGKVGQMAAKLVDSVVPANVKAEVLHAVVTVIPNFHAEFAAALVPLAGLATAGGAAIWNAATASLKQYTISESRMHAQRSLAGLEAQAAIGAMIRILVRERNADLVSMSASLVEFGGKLAGMALDGGAGSTAAVGLAANVVKLLNIIRIVARDVMEKNAANRQMALGNVDITIFETCPLVGCYLVCCAPTSVLMSLILERFGERGWMDTLERSRSRHLEPLQAEARKVIQNHRFEIVKLRNYPGVMSVNTKELERMAANVGKSGMVGFGSAG